MGGYKEVVRMRNVLVPIGHGSYVNRDHLIAIVRYESAPVKRQVQAAREQGMLIDATMGRRTLSVLCMDSGHVVLCANQTDTIAKRANADD
jgi:regulator of extracellular matrix RemA (YlzA/DUF370 family)